jgi:hypothetical protein
MSYFADILTGAQIHSVWTDAEVTYIMLSNGTQVTIRGVVVIQPKQTPPMTATPPSAGVTI